ncbi:MAG: CDP-glucose 4,6-dehydratase, partial [Pseudomonadota bacterium]|nr:CDP-glucose 4,6-dehydratase [Pseudomonadota bacterium]
MEGLDMTSLEGVYDKRRVLVTGHTGFKGSWLALWLARMGANVTGLSLPPETTPNHWDLLKPDIADIRGDIRDSVAVANAVQTAGPEIVFHLAAQPLVRRSYRDPLETWATNVMGTANLLEACRKSDSVRAIVVITTDKCYENMEWIWGYRENDRLGGHDPYSASKAGVELVASSYRKSFFSGKNAPLLATARAGNVVGGGDWSEDRLIPDLVRAIWSKTPLVIRSPYATRPWQHVLEPLSGYLMLGKKLLEGDRRFADAWNFGPDDTGNQTVETVLTRLRKNWLAVTWEI